MREKMIRSKPRCMFAVIIVIAALFVFMNLNEAKAVQIPTEGGASTNNEGDQNYGNWTSPMKSYLVSNSDGTFTRIEEASSSGGDSTIVRETYSEDFELQSSATIPMEGDYFGGFYSGSNANYFVFGNNNSGEDNSKNVFVVVKYSKGWVKQGTANLGNCNTTIPFDAGSLRMAESGDYLYVRTAREMYKSSDGKNHQSNFMFQVNTNDMTVTDYTKNLYVSYGYVSHSFDQHIQADGSNIAAMDLGDFSKRGLNLVVYNGVAGQSTHWSGSTTTTYVMKEFPSNESEHYNYTGCNIGGFETTSSSYLTVGIYNDTDTSKVKNLFVGTVKKNSVNSAGTNFRYITSYSSSDKKTVSTPQLVKISETRFMLIWEVTDKDNEQEASVKRIHYMLLNQDGESVSEERVISGRLSDCKPVVSGDSIVWYYTNNTSPVFCEIPVDGSQGQDSGIEGKDYFYVNIKDGDEITKTCAFKYGSTATVQAPAGTNGKGFDCWSYSSIDGLFNDDNKYDSTLSFDMPGEDVELRYTLANGYNVSVTNGSGSGIYVPGRKVVVKATPDSGKCLDHWEATGINLEGNMQYNPTIEFTMPENNVSLTGVLGTPKHLYNDMTELKFDYISSHQYTGHPIKAEDFNAKISCGDIQYTEGEDYTVEPDESVINAGFSGYVYFIGKNRLCGNIGWSYRITKRNMKNVDVTIPSVTYNGNVQVPLINAMNGDVPVISGTDFNVSPTTGFTEVGEHNVTLTGVGANYTGTVTKKFVIEPQSLDSEDITVSDIASCQYNGQGHNPEPVVQQGTKTLVKGTDYELSYSNNTNAGDNATVTITGKGNYKDPVDKTFTITKKALSDEMVALNKTEFAYNGQNQKPDVTVSDGSALTAQDYSVTNNGGTGVGEYEVTVTAAANGNYSGSVTKKYTIAPKALTSDMISITSDQVVYDGSEHTPAFKVMDGEKELVKDTDYEVVSDGKGRAAGSYDIKISGKGNYSGNATKEFTISKKPLADTMVTLSEAEFAYNGQNQKPTVTVVDGALMTNADYQVTNNGGTNAGDYKVTVTGTDSGNYSGSIEKSFRINPKDITDESVTVNVAGGSTYNGSGQEPNVTVKDGDTDLEADKDFEVAYSDNINAGENAKATITGKGNYKGSRTATFAIAKLPITDDVVKLSATEFTYNGSLQKPEVTVEGGDLMGENDYQITNNGGTNVGEYEVTVTAAANGNYSGSVTKKYTIAPKALTSDMISITSDQVVYDGTEHTPEFKVMNGETELVEDTDYEVVSDGKGTAAGSYDIKISGKGNYSGNATKAFTISKKPLADTMVTLDGAEFTYNGQNQKPTVTVVDGALMANADYQVTNNGGTNAGDYKVTVTGTDSGNYSGSIEKSFRINPKDIADESVTVNVAGGSTYNGSGQEPNVTVKDGDKALNSGADFVLAYSDNKNVGNNAKVTITGKGNYTGIRYETFAIAKASVENANVVISKGNSETIEKDGKEVFVLNGDAVEPQVKVTVGGKELTAEDYDVSYENNEQATEDAVVKIAGKGNYEGEKETKFTIITKEEADRIAAENNSSGNEGGGNEGGGNGSGNGTGGKTGEQSGNNAVDKAAQEARERAEKEKAAREAREKAEKEKAAREAREKAEKEKAAREAREKAEKEKAAREAREKAEKEKAEKEKAEKEKARKEQKGADGTALGEGASAEAAEAAILGMNGDSDPAGAAFSKLQLRSPKQTKNSIKLAWKKVGGAARYIVYGNRCGNKNKKIGEATSASFNVKKADGKALKKGTSYKFLIIAVDSNNNVVSSSKIIHVVTAGGKTGNHKKVVVKAKTGKKVKTVKKAVIKVKKTLKLKTSLIPAKKKLKVKKHVAVRYESDNTKVASVNKKGVIKAVKKGKCTVYAFAQNGVFAKVKITVK